MDFKDNKWQHPDKESGEGAGRDGNANRSNRARPRFTTSAPGKNFSSSNENKPRFNQERDNSQSQRPYSREDGNRTNTQRNYNSNNNNNSSRSFNKPTSNDGQRPYNREGNRDYAPRPYHGANDAPNSNRSYASQDSNQRREEMIRGIDVILHHGLIHQITGINEMILIIDNILHVNNKNTDRRPHHVVMHHFRMLMNHSD
jgi:hypothetical protein